MQSYISFKMMHFLMILALIAGLHKSAALKDVVVKFPDHVAVGDDIEITCQYDLEDDILYNLKWFKGTSEFFRYTPNEKPEIKIFNVKNVHVDLSSSSMNTVKLINISHASKGNYTCEISTDAPRFITMSNSKTLQFEPLENTPKNIHMVIPPIVKISDSVKLSCSYNPTKDNAPLKSVSWKKNGKLFYKYEPDIEINIAVQKYPGINFSVKQKSNSSEVTLHNAAADTEDVYTCQIDYPTSTLTSSGFILVKGQSSRPVTLTVPTLVNEGENVKLKCEFNFEKANKNGVKWLKGNREFYRYTPNEDPTITLFEGVDVEDLITNDDYRSFVSIVLLKNVTTNTAGRYRCQVTTNEGLFLHMESKDLAVIRLPHGEPTLVVENNYLRPGEYVHAECISPPSYPYADITWLLNGKVVSGNLRKESKANKPVAFPYPSSSSLSHEIRFDDGSQAELTCVITIPDVYRREKSVTIEKDSSNVVTPISDYYNVHPSFTSSGGYSWTKASVSIFIISSHLMLMNW